MKKLSLAAIAFAAIIAVSACSDKKETPAAGNATADKPKVESDSFEPTTNIRYYNLDTVMNNSKMLEAFKEVNLQKLREYQSAENSRTNELNRMQSDIETKARNNGYLSQESYNYDMAQLQKRYESAQQYLASLQNAMQEETARQQQDFFDALNNYLAEYNKKHHYDAILVYAPGEHFNPKMDITADVLKGVNDAYLKDHPESKDTDDAKKEKE